MIVYRRVSCSTLVVWKTRNFQVGQNMPVLFSIHYYRITGEPIRAPSVVLHELRTDIGEPFRFAIPNLLYRLVGS